MTFKSLYKTLGAAMLCTLALTSCGGGGNDEPTPGPTEGGETEEPTKPSEKQTLRVLFWNIQNGMWSGQGEQPAYKSFEAFIKEQNPDICMFAEAKSNYQTASDKGFTSDADRYFPDNWGAFAMKYGHKYWYIGGYRDNFPQVITSKYPLTNVAKIVGNSDTIVSHGAGWATTEVYGRKLNLVTLHTWPQSYAYGVAAADQAASTAAKGGDYYRAKEMDYICKHTILTSKSAASELWIMAGDFNSRSRVDNFQYNYPEDDTRFLVHDVVAKTTPYVDIIGKRYTGEFVSSTAGTARIDFMYCTQPLYKCITKAFMIRNSYTTPVRDSQGLSNFYHPSDHTPILVEFDLNKL